MNKTSFLYIMFLVLTIAACTKKPTPAGYQATRTVAPEALGDSTAYLIADTILYDVVIQNPDSSDEWTARRLRKVDHKTLADMIFDGIYSGKLKAYKYMEQTPMTIEEVKAMESEEGNGRDNIAKMQFEEQWYLDQKTYRFSKRIIAVMLAYEINGLENRYRAGIKVYLP